MPAVDDDDEDSKTDWDTFEWPENTAMWDDDGEVSADGLTSAVV